MYFLVVRILDDHRDISLFVAGLRVYNGTICNLEPHIDRLTDSAKALAYVDIPSRDAIKVSSLFLSHSLTSLFRCVLPLFSFLDSFDHFFEKHSICPALSIF